MNDINPFDGLHTIAPPPQRQTGTSDLGQSDFLTLMVTQFRNQDPFEPMDNGDFLGQLAQFSTVSGIDSLNSGFDSLATSIQDEQALQAASLVGRSVVAISDSAYLGPNEPLQASVDLDAYASSVQIDIKDSSGQLVQSLNLGEQQAGIVKFAWNGLDAEGRLRSPGNYELSARTVSGTRVESIQTLVDADIESVTLGQRGEGMTLNLRGGNELSLGQIYQIN